MSITCISLPEEYVPTYAYTPAISTASAVSDKLRESTIDGFAGSDISITWKSSPDISVTA